MSIIVDPSDLNRNTEIYITPATKLIRLEVAGNLTTDGVTWQCVYSFCMQQWISQPDLNLDIFPLTSVTAEQGELLYGWNFEDATTRELIRTGGWAVKATPGAASSEEWAGIITLGTIGALEQAYYYQNAGVGPVNFVLTGPVNQAVQTYSNGVFDYRASFSLYCREWGKTYEEASISDIGVASMTYQAYRFPLANSVDANITHTEVYVNGNLPYTGMHLTWYALVQNRTIGGVAYGFFCIIDGNSGTPEQIYEYVQAQLRKAVDIDEGAGTKIGKVTRLLTAFTGTDFSTLYSVDATGVYIDNHRSIDRNRLTFDDDTNTGRQFPYTALLTINFNTYLTTDIAAKYWVYFTTLPGGQDFGTAGAIVVEDAAAVDISGNVGGSASIVHSFDYDNNVQGGRVAATDADITIVCLGLATGQYTLTTATITRSETNACALAAEEELNYVAAGAPEVAFNGVTKIITVGAGITTIDMAEVYSWWKDWAQTGSNSKYLQTFSVIGGQPTVGGNYITPYFFAENGWVIRPDEANHTLTVTGIVLVPGGATEPFIATIGAFNVSIRSIVPIRSERVAGDETAIALAVWASVVESGLTATEVLRLLTAVSTGKSTVVPLGGGAATVSFQDMTGVKNRVVATMAGSERAVVVLDGT